MSRAEASGISSRTKATVSDDARFSKIKTVSATDYYATGSNRGTSGFIIESAGNTTLFATEGGSIAASSLTAKTLYEIGIKQVSGSGTVHLVY